MRLFYIANHQLPTTKAHGLQIMKMCEAFSGLDAECELVIPMRGIDPDITETDPLRFHGVNDSFKITRLSSFDFIKWGDTFIGKPLFWLQQLSFGRSVKNYLKNKEGIVYSRDPFSISMLNADRHRIYWEAHNFPRNIDSKFYKNILQKIDGLVVISQGLKNEFSKYYDGKIIVASDAVDVNEFNIDISRDDARIRLGLPLNKNIAMYVGHLYRWKGVEMLVKASEFLNEDNLIIIVGGLKDDRERLLDEVPAGSLDKIKFIDYVSHSLVPAYLKSADCLVLTGKGSEAISGRYTSPLKLFEYMASKKPIVAQDLPSFREILNEYNSILVQPDDPGALAEGINLAFSDKNTVEKITANAFRDVQSRSWANRAKTIINYLK